MSCCGQGSERGPRHSRGHGCGCGHTGENHVETELESLERLQRDLEQEVADVAARLKRLKEEQQAKVEA